MGTTEFRCCVEHTGCGNMVDCPYDFKELFSHLTPGETQTVVCDKIGDLVCIHAILDGTLYYRAENGKIYDKKCYNCGVEWLDDQCSTEQARCDSCIIDGVCTKWEVDQWCLDNNQLYTSKLKGV